LATTESRLAWRKGKPGVHVIPLDRRDACAFGGGLHRCTAGVYRKGACEDYFPKGQIWENLSTKSFRKLCLVRPNRIGAPVQIGVYNLAGHHFHHGLTQ